MCDNQTNGPRLRQSQHGHDADVATVLSVDMKFALMEKHTRHVIYWSVEYDVNTCSLCDCAYVFDLLFTFHILRFVKGSPCPSSVKGNDGSYTPICYETAKEGRQKLLD